MSRPLAGTTARSLRSRAQALDPGELDHERQVQELPELGLPFDRGWREGAFALPDITVEGMTARVRQKLLEAGLPDGVASAPSSEVPKLARWIS